MDNQAEIAIYDNPVFHKKNILLQDQVFIFLREVQKVNW